MIRLAQMQDLNQVVSLTKACAEHMMANGIYQWNEHYPNRSAFEMDIDGKDLFVLETDDLITGCVTVTTKKDEEYIPVKWLSKTEQNIYVHRLAVHPKVQGRGYARQLMDFAENFARKHGHESVRLDTFSQNQRNQKFYKQRGYRQLETIYFPKQSDHPFYCYELLL